MVMAGAGWGTDPLASQLQGASHVLSLCLLGCAVCHSPVLPAGWETPPPRRRGLSGEAGGGGVQGSWKPPS